MNIRNFLIGICLISSFGACAPVSQFQQDDANENDLLGVEKELAICDSILVDLEEKNPGNPFWEPVHERDGCFVDIAVKLNDLTICEKVTPGLAVENCYADVYLANSGAYLNPDSRDFCLSLPESRFIRNAQFVQGLEVNPRELCLDGIVELNEGG